MTFLTHTIPLPEPITIQTPINQHPRPRVIQPGAEIELGDLTFEALDCAFWISPINRQVRAQIAGISHTLLLYGADDFAGVVSDAAEQHASRLLQILGSDQASTLQMLANGVQPPMPTRVPHEIAAWRAKAVLDLSGLLSEVQSLIASVPGEQGTVVRRAWENNSPVHRHGPTVQAIAQSLNLSPDQLDGLFIQAASLQV